MTVRPSIALLLLSACVGPHVEQASEPRSAYGQTQIEIQLGSQGIEPSAVQHVRVGGVLAYDLKPHDQALTVTLQGGKPGLAEVVLHVGDNTISAGHITYADPIDPLFERMAAFGASLTQGTWNRTPSFESQLAGPAARIAQTVGAYFPLPLLAHDLLPQLDIDDIGPAPDCRLPNVEASLASSALEVLGSLKDEQGNFSWAVGRIDASLEPANLAVGGWRLADILNGPSNSIEQSFMGHLILEPTGTMTSPMQGATQIERLQAMHPSLIISTDMFANDVIYAITADKVDLDAITPTEDLIPDIQTTVDRVAATGAEVFLATLPRADFLYAARHLDRDKLDEVVAIQDDLNKALVDAASQYPNVHIVDAAAWVENIGRSSIQVGSYSVSTRAFDGLLSLDGVHFTAIGYAFLAQLFLDKITEVTGIEIPPIDIEKIAEHDPNAPWNLKKRGFSPEACRVDPG